MAFGVPRVRRSSPTCRMPELTVKTINIAVCYSYAPNVQKPAEPDGIAGKCRQIKSKPRVTRQRNDKGVDLHASMQRSSWSLFLSCSEYEHWSLALSWQKMAWAAFLHNSARLLSRTMDRAGKTSSGAASEKEAQPQSLAS
jgi:hypothetical protein